jgi:hypothetical protein
VKKGEEMKMRREGETIRYLPRQERKISAV